MRAQTFEMHSQLTNLTGLVNVLQINDEETDAEKKMPNVRNPNKNIQGIRDGVKAVVG